VSGKLFLIHSQTQCFDGVERFSIRLGLTSASEKIYVKKIKWIGVKKFGLFERSEFLNFSQAV